MMELIASLADFILHIDKHLFEICTQYGNWTYVVLFLIVFCETGLVVTPFLPGDSLLFAVGALAAIGAIDVWMITILLLIAAILGDSLNYRIGAYFGPKVFHFEDSRLFRKEYLLKTQAFYERHGGKTIIFARFMPIIRTFAPFVAGIGTMAYRRFILFNVTGAIAWVVGFIFAGYFFGNIPLIKKNFTAVIFAIIFISILPGLIEFLRLRYAKKTA